MKKFDQLVILAFALSGLTFFYKTPQYYDIIFTLFLFGLAIFNFNKINIRHICGIIIVFKLAIFSLMNFYLLEYMSNFKSLVDNTVIYGVQLIALILLAVIMFFRPVISRFLHNKTSAKSNPDISITFADNLLFITFSILAAVTLLAFVENLIRNLDYLGVNEEFAKIFWQWTFFYDNYEIFIHIGELFICFIVLCQSLINQKELADKVASQ
ncbi:hypothetical protein SG34_020155 [Thalassomonas viridans]|uniref:Uncharacterized protein n=1 Tax=Thalassomonas viridans TaxID=137584 RepID=A0AAE9Z1U0_9GAMM|nr:hypothetical protein [Thalassomonas viridans]WDE03677.1 hypothetical protein SG34_020155 [Thalassomonas viridans]